MPDEATASLFSLIHELTEGQQWVKNHLLTHPKYSWAIDPFGHSSTYSHLLKASNINAMVIQVRNAIMQVFISLFKLVKF